MPAPLFHLYDIPLAWFRQADPGSKKHSEAMFSIIESLNKAFVDLGKANKLGTKIASLAEAVDPKTSRLVADYKDLIVKLEDCEKASSDLGFLIRFKKSREGHELNVEVGQAALNMSARALQDLIDVSKTVKALLPGKDKEAQA